MHEKKPTNIPGYLLMHVQSGSQSFVRLLNLISRVYPKQIIGSFRFKVMNLLVYLLQWEVIKEVDYFRCQIKLLLCIFIKQC